MWTSNDRVHGKYGGSVISEKWYHGGDQYTKTVQQLIKWLSMFIKYQEYQFSTLAMLTFLCFHIDSSLKLIS